MAADVDAVAFVIYCFRNSADVESFFEDDRFDVGFVEEFVCGGQARRACADYYCCFFVHSHASWIILSMDFRGFHLKSSLIFLLLAISTAGSPSRLSVSSVRKSTPVISLHFSIISRTENPFSLPRLNFFDCEFCVRASRARTCAATRSSTWI